MEGSILNVTQNHTHKNHHQSILKTYAISSLERLIFFFSSFCWSVLVFLRRLPIFVMTTLQQMIFYESLALPSFSIHPGLRLLSPWLTSLYKKAKEARPTPCEPVIWQFSCKLLVSPDLTNGLTAYAILLQAFTDLTNWPSTIWARASWKQRGSKG